MIFQYINNQKFLYLNVKLNKYLEKFKSIIIYIIYTLLPTANKKYTNLNFIKVQHVTRNNLSFQIKYPKKLT